MSATALPLDPHSDARVGDYLDDKLQTLADLESLDGLLLAVRDQQALLRKQLEDAQTDLEEAHQASVDHDASLKGQVAEFEQEQQDIDRRLKAITMSDTSDVAVRRFESSMDKLRKLDVAKGYVEVLQLVETASNACLSNLGSSNSTSLKEYTRLRRLISEMKPLQDAADGAAPHLLHHIEASADDLKQRLEINFVARFETTLKKISWPAPDATVPDSLRDEFATNVIDLLKLQTLDLEAQEQLNESAKYVPLILLPLKVMVAPLELGFRYHFEGDRPTNRLERPEFFLSHITERILVKYADFMDEFIQPILFQQFRGTDFSLNYAYIDATSAFITAVLPMVRRKLNSVVPRVIQQPPLLSHLLHELMKFDTQLREEWQYDGGSRADTWIGLAGEVLNKDDNFAQWLNAEKDFALSRYHEIVEASDSFDLDFDSVGSGKTKPTKAAIRVNDLLEATTDNYRELVTFSHKLRFLLDIQISIFDLFHERLAGALSAYLARTSTIGRASREDQASLQGLAGLERLCKVFGSADYLERAMRDWNDDVFFLELWSDLQHRASARSTGAVVAGLTVAQVAARTSSSLNSDPSTPSGEEEFESGALFDETASAYSRIRSRTESIMSELLNNNVRQSVAPYTKINPWATLSPIQTGGADSHSSTTAELDGLLQNLQTLLAYLVRALGTVPLRRLAKQMLHALESTLLDQIIMRHSFSGAGVTQLAIDINAVGSVVARAVDVGMVDVGMGKIHQAVKLLGLPIKQSKEKDEAGDELGLFEVSKRLFEGSGEDARNVLDEMGLDRLSVGEARKTLARRVELGS